MQKVISRIGPELPQLANMLMSVIDFEASRQRKHVTARYGWSQPK